MLGFDQALDSSLSSVSDNDEENPSRRPQQVFIKHLRKCFIASDDNGCCEQSILPDLKVFNDVLERDASEQTDGEYLRSVLSKRIGAKSYEYVKTNISKDNRGFVSSDKTSFNPKFLSRLNSSASTTSEAKFDSLPPSNEDPTEERKYVSDLVFEARTQPVKVVPVVSPLTILIRESSNEKNPFQEYLKHEAYIQDPNLVKKFRIFLPGNNTGTKTTMPARDFMIVTVHKSARICELIGLVCCKYTSEKRSPPLKFDNVSSYYLKIADDTGEIEFELAPLESGQKVGRFGFNDLALVEKSSSEPNSPAFKPQNSTNFNFPPVKTSVAVNFTDGTPKAMLYFDSDNIAMDRVFDEILKIKLANSTIFCPRLAYRLEHADQPGTSINVEKTYLNDFKSCPSKYTFYFFRENSVRRTSPVASPTSKISPDKTTPTDLTKKINESSEYDVTYLSKWRKVPFKIEISKETFELEEIKPVEITKLRLTSKLSNFYTISSKYVVSCGYLREKEVAGKSQIRIIVVEEEPAPVYKHLDFECEPIVADDIIKTFNQIFLYCNSAYYKQYQQSKTKKSIKWSRRLYNSERLKHQSSSSSRQA